MQGLRVVLDLMMGHKVLVLMQVSQLEAHVHRSLMPAHVQPFLMQAVDIHGGHMPVNIPERLT